MGRPTVRRNTLASLALFLLALGGLALIGAPFGQGKGGETVTVYTSVDRNFAEPVLQAYQDRTGVRVEALYDVEAAKTTGLVNKLIAEAGRPRADVFWNGEFLQTAQLAQEGVLAPLGDDGPEMWAEFGGRARVLIVNTERHARENWPSSVMDIASPRVPADQIAIAHPLFGTSATHAAALYALWGRDAALDFYRGARDRGVRIVDGNSVVRDLVASGEVLFGLTDTDDACGARAAGYPVAVVFPDQAAGAMGTLVIPNTVALIAGAPHPEAGRALIGYLLSEEVAGNLADAGWFQVDGTTVLAPPSCGLPDRIRPMTTDAEALVDALAGAKRDLRGLLVR